MGQRKGYTGNPNGRPKGSPNRSTKQIREAISLFVDNNIDKIQREFNRMEPRDKLAFFERILRYVIPTKRENLNVEAMSDAEVVRLASELIDQMNNGNADPDDDNSNDDET